jgi:FtsP/CotA-like multicopper oxidase with cupredoxin domain
MINITLVHIMPFSFLRKMPDMDDHQMNDLNTHARDGMGGLIMGIHVLSSKLGSEKMINRTERNLTLIVQEQPNRFDTLPGKGFVLLEGNVTSASQQISIPGPPIILTRDEPVAIKIINTLQEPTTIHWHGLEIESYFDGAAGWGNSYKKLAPLVMPGASFVAHLTPPRAGTFIYHTHMHDEQLIAGMYGPLIVMEPGQKFDPETNKILLISSGPHLEPPIAMLNGTFKPDTMQLILGMKYRFRLINITALNPDLKVSFLFKGKPVSWQAIAKDGANLPPQQVVMMPAAAQQITIGETRDFEFRPGETGSYSFEVRSGSGTELFVTMVMQVK